MQQEQQLPAAAAAASAGAAAAAAASSSPTHELTSFGFLEQTDADQDASYGLGAIFSRVKNALSGASSGSAGPAQGASSTSALAATAVTAGAVPALLSNSYPSPSVSSPLAYTAALPSNASQVHAPTAAYSPSARTIILHASDIKLPSSNTSPNAPRTSAGSAAASVGGTANVRRSMASATGGHPLQHTLSHQTNTTSADSGDTDAANPAFTSTSDLHGSDDSMPARRISGKNKARASTPPQRPGARPGTGDSGTDDAERSTDSDFFQTRLVVNNRPATSEDEGDDSSRGDLLQPGGHDMYRGPSSGTSMYNAPPSTRPETIRTVSSQSVSRSTSASGTAARSQEPVQSPADTEPPALPSRSGAMTPRPLMKRGATGATVLSVGSKNSGSSKAGVMPMPLRTTKAAVPAPAITFTTPAHATTQPGLSGSQMPSDMRPDAASSSNTQEGNEPPETPRADGSGSRKQLEDATIRRTRAASSADAAGGRPTSPSTASSRRPALAVFQSPAAAAAAAAVSGSMPTSTSASSSLGRVAGKTSSSGAAGGGEWYSSIPGFPLRDADTTAITRGGDGDDSRSIRSISSASLSLAGRGPPTTLRRPTAVLGLNMDSGASLGGPSAAAGAVFGSSPLLPGAGHHHHHGHLPRQSLPSGTSSSTDTGGPMLASNNASMDDLSIASGAVVAAAAAAAAARYNYAAALAQHGHGSPGMPSSASFGLASPGLAAVALAKRRGSAASSSMSIVGSPANALGGAASGGRPSTSGAASGTVPAFGAAGVGAGASTAGGIPFPSSALGTVEPGTPSPILASSVGSGTGGTPSSVPVPIVPIGYSSFNLHASIGLGLGAGASGSAAAGAGGAGAGAMITGGAAGNGSAARSGLQTSADAMYRRMRGESLSRKYWMADEVAKECRECLSTFTPFRRKHHCRICGQIFCGRCASHIISFGENDMIRVCNFCLNMLDEYERSGAGMHSSSGSISGREPRISGGAAASGSGPGGKASTSGSLARSNSGRVRATSGVTATSSRAESQRKGLYALMGMNLSMSSSSGARENGSGSSREPSTTSSAVRMRTQSAVGHAGGNAAGRTSRASAAGGSTSSMSIGGGLLASLGLWGGSSASSATSIDSPASSVRRGNSTHRAHSSLAKDSFPSRAGSSAGTGGGVGISNFLTASSGTGHTSSAGPPGRVRRDMISSPLEAQVRSPQAEFAANALFKRTLPATFGLDAQDAYLLALHQQQQQQQSQASAKGGRGAQFSGMPGWQGFGTPSALQLAGIPPDTKLSAASLAQLRANGQTLSAQERAMARVMVAGGGGANAHDDADTDAGTERETVTGGAPSVHGGAPHSRSNSREHKTGDAADLGRVSGKEVDVPVGHDDRQSAKSGKRRKSAGGTVDASKSHAAEAAQEDEAAPFRKTLMDDPSTLAHADSEADADAEAAEDALNAHDQDVGGDDATRFDRQHKPHLKLSNPGDEHAADLDLSTPISLPEPGVGFLTPALGTPTFAITPAAAATGAGATTASASSVTGKKMVVEGGGSIGLGDSPKESAATKATRAVSQAAGISFPRTSGGSSNAVPPTNEPSAVAPAASTTLALPIDNPTLGIPFASPEDMQRVRLLSDVALRQAYQRSVLLSHPSGLAHLGADLNEMLLMTRPDNGPTTPNLAVLDPDESFNFARAGRRSSVFGMEGLTNGSRSGLMSRAGSHGVHGVIGGLSELSLQHLHRMLGQVLERAGIKRRQQWDDMLTTLLLQALANVRTNPRGGGTSDIRNYIKIKKVAGGKITDSKYVNGVICTKNVASKKMAKNLPLRNARVMIVTFPLDYHRSENQFVSLEPMIAQEEEYTRILVARIVALRPQLLVVEKVVSRLALGMLEREGITVVWSMKPSAIEAISRCTQADIISSMDRLALNPGLGRCAFFDVKTYELAGAPDKRKALMHFEGQSRDVAGTILIRGGSTVLLKRIKSILNLMIFIGNTIRLEEHLMQNEGATIIPPTPLVRPIARVAKMTPVNRILQETQPGSDLVDEPENLTLQGIHEKWDSLDTDATPQSSPSLDEDELLLQRCRGLINDLLKRYEETLLSASPAVHFSPPFPLLKLKRNDDRLIELKKQAEEEETARILADERRDSSVVPTPAESRVMSPSLPGNSQMFTDRGDPALLSLSLGSDASSILGSVIDHGSSDRGSMNASTMGRRTGTLDLALQDPNEVAKEQEYPIAREKHLSQLRLWQEYLEHVPDNISPFSHQKLTLLVSTICSVTLRPCEGPTQHTVEFYGFGDETLGGYVERTCANHTTICSSKGCDRQQLLHYKTYVHDQTRVQVVLERFVCPIPGEEDRILMWSYCKICEVATPVSPMSEEAWHYSFAKYLELHFYADKTWKTAMCHHDFYRDHVRYYAFQNLAIRFHSDPIDSMEIAVPDIKLYLKPATRSSLKNEEALNLQQKNNTYWNTVVARLKALASTPCPERDAATKEKGRQVLGELLKRCESHRREIENLIARTYRTSGPFDVLALNSVCRVLQEKVVQWDVEFAEFEKLYLPTDRDIRRLTTSHIKRLFEQRDSTDRVAEVLGLPCADELDETGSEFHPGQSLGSADTGATPASMSAASSNGGQGISGGTDKDDSAPASSSASIMSMPTGPSDAAGSGSGPNTPSTNRNSRSAALQIDSDQNREVLETDSQPSSPNVTRTPGQMRTPRPPGIPQGREHLRSRANSAVEESSCTESEAAGASQVSSMIRRFESPQKAGTVKPQTPLRRPPLRRGNTEGSSPPVTNRSSKSVNASTKAPESASDLDQGEGAPSVSSRASSPTRRILPPPGRMSRLPSRQSVLSDAKSASSTPRGSTLSTGKRSMPPPNSFQRFAKDLPAGRKNAGPHNLSKTTNGSDTESSTAPPRRPTQQMQRNPSRGRGGHSRSGDRSSVDQQNNSTIGRNAPSTGSGGGSTIKASGASSRASRVPIPIPGKDSNHKTRVSTIARHFDRLSREAERERERNRQIMAIRARRAQPVGVTQARVAVFSSMRDAVRDEDSDSDDEDEDGDRSSRADNGRRARVGPTGETANDAEDEAEPDSDAEVVRRGTGAGGSTSAGSGTAGLPASGAGSSSLTSTSASASASASASTSATPAGTSGANSPEPLLGSTASVNLPSDSSLPSASSSLAEAGKHTMASIMDSIASAGSQLAGIDVALGAVSAAGAGLGAAGRPPGSDADSVVSDRSSILKTLSGFLAFRAGDHLPLLEYPLSATEHLFADSRVILREDEPSSIIAFTLSSSNYRERLQSTHAAYQRVTERKEAFMPGGGGGGGGAKRSKGKTSTVDEHRGSTHVELPMTSSSSVQGDRAEAGHSAFSIPADRSTGSVAASSTGGAGGGGGADDSVATAVQSHPSTPVPGAGPGAGAPPFSEADVSFPGSTAGAADTASIRSRAASVAMTEVGTAAGTGGPGTDAGTDEAWDMIDLFEVSSEVEAALKKPEGTHFKFEYQSGSTKFFCKIFFAEQFDALRRCCGCAESFVDSLARCVKWDSSGGKSGSAFLKTRDDRLVVKQLSRAEMDGFSKFAPSYFEYLASCLFKDRPTTLAKVFGCFRIGYRNPQTGKSLKMDCMVMENLFYGREVSKIFDLKGSMRNRHIQETGRANEVLLDENLVELAYQSPLFVRDHSKRLLRAALWNDSMFLAEMNVMDYSLIVGVDKGNLELVVGIIDFLRPYTWDKRVESFVKDTGLLGGGSGKEPTIITPKMYRGRFLAFLNKSFLM
ncbi:Mitochondrial distribution and morphology protein 12, partial [Tilletia horrida]